MGGACLWGVSVVVLVLGALHKAHRINGNDFTMYLDAARALIAGRNPYAIGGTYRTCIRCSWPRWSGR